MEIDPSRTQSMYRTLSGAVVPRPIAWVSTTSEDGVDNLAPYSFFNVVSSAPPTLLFAPGDRPGGYTDTARNAIDTGEFVVNVVDRAMAEAMNATSATLRRGESEFEHAGVEAAPSTRVRPPRVAASPVSFECELTDFVEIGTGNAVFGEVVYAHVDDAVTTDGKLDVTKLDAVGRLAGSYYCTTRDRFRMVRPD
ncbi:flavin reductase family protein [Halomarina pelagica]|uniref:flavin reductase family protein n=1 Tax=Halomarina pelagica TaxID=2961599 RepID=UPI0020C52141|nr:flavin reductase family protein [Halomarina sp. BND7]